MSDARIPDPLDALRGASVAVAPAPEFTARLRARIERALTLPKGVTVSNLAPAAEDPGAEAAAPEPASTGTTAAPGDGVITPYLAVSDARRAIEYYVSALLARPVGDPIVMPDGRIGHAELVLPGGALLMLADAHPEIGFVAPLPGAGVSVNLHLTVSDVDAAIERAVQSGADLQRPAADYEYGRNGVVLDPFGHRWQISASPSTGIRHGDIAYVSLWVPDVVQASAFFSAVLGWDYQPASGREGRQVTGQSLHHGIQGGQARSNLFVCAAVDDLDAALARVADGGGTPGQPEVAPYGRVAMCADDQGVSFALVEPPDGVQAARDPSPPLHGDLAYLTFEVVDSRRARRFYGDVLGWQFVPGRVADGWQIEGPQPMGGMLGGCDEATTVPMYNVRDIAAAVAAVRAAGGTATDPEQQPYGPSSTCTDDQGTRFYLGQL